MDIQPQTQQPISDDQELAKVLAGVNQQADSASGLQFEETSVPTATATASAPVVEEPVTPPSDEPIMPTLDSPVIPTPAAPANNGNLDSIKSDALQELRPLVDKLNVSPEEKFDTYFLLLRSTDDTSLVGPAHAAAQAITDETRKAQALLDIIKEIDYLSAPQQQ